MEKFAVDLDAVLDELEQFEVETNPSTSSSTHRSSNNNSTIRTNSRDQIPVPGQTQYRESPILTAYSSSSRSIDSREADFSIQIRPPKILAFDNPNYNNSQNQTPLASSASNVQDLQNVENMTQNQVDSSSMFQESSQSQAAILTSKSSIESFSSSPSSSKLLSSPSSPVAEENIHSFSASPSSSSLSLSSPSKCDNTSKTALLPDLCLSENDSTPPISDCENLQLQQQTVLEESSTNERAYLNAPTTSVLPNLVQITSLNPMNSSIVPAISTQPEMKNVHLFEGIQPKVETTPNPICDKIATICDIIQDSLPVASTSVPSSNDSVLNVSTSLSFANESLIDSNIHSPGPPLRSSVQQIPAIGPEKAGSSESSGYGDDDDDEANVLSENEQEHRNNNNSKISCPPDLVTDSHSKASALADSSFRRSPNHNNNDEVIVVDNLTETELDKFLSDLNDDAVVAENEMKNIVPSDKIKEEVKDDESRVRNSDNPVDPQSRREYTENNNQINKNELQNCHEQLKVMEVKPMKEEIIGENLCQSQTEKSFDEVKEQESANKLSDIDLESSIIQPEKSLKVKSEKEPAVLSTEASTTVSEEEYDPELEELKQLEQELAREEELEALEREFIAQESKTVEEISHSEEYQSQDIVHSQLEPLETLIQVQSALEDSVPDPAAERIPETEEIQPENHDQNALLSTAAEKIAGGSISETVPQTILLPELVSSAVSSQESSLVNNPSSSGPSGVEDRGGLVQNIAYFERQEMPNGLMEHEQMLGKVKPFWVPDEEAQNCLHCDVKFTLIKRRHHCRSCGKVLCSQCCNYKAKLMYLESKEARVCRLCFEILMRIEAIERRNGRPLEIVSRESNPEVSSSTSITFPDPNNPSEYCSTLSPFDQVAIAPQPPTVMVPVGVLKRRNTEPGSGTSGDNHSVPKQVIFSDGVRPGGDLIEHGTSSSRLPEDRSKSGRPQLQLKIPSKPSMEGLILKRKGKPHKVIINDRQGQVMPPIVNYHELRAIDPNLEFLENYEQLVEFLKADWLPSITFNLAKNLFLNAKLVMKDCCKRGWCWSFASRGLASVGQDEVLFVLDCDSYKPENGTTGEDKPGEVTNISEQNKDFNFPRDVFKLFLKIYDSASNACLFGEMSHLFFPDGLFGKKENAGFVFVLPTMQCFRNLLLPSPPALIALIIHKWEIPWVKIFPLRLVLRLGHEYNSYPTPVISDANRKSVYYEIGHTIMNVLADFRNFSYTLFTAKDLLIHTEQRKRVKMVIPKASYEQVCKVLSTSNDHVLAFGANFSGKADSHFVCMQHEFDLQGEYQTAVSTLPDVSEPGITAASFIVFSGALKSTTGLKAKMSVVEDGLLVQIPAQTMEEMRTALREMKEFKILCCKIGETLSDEWVEIVWVNDELSTNLGVRSQIDSMNLEGVQSARIFSSPDFTNERFLIRWIEIFILQINENTRRSEMVNTSRLAESVAQAFCLSMVEFLDQLFEAGFTKIGLRISLDVDRVGYESGSNGTALPEMFTANLDGALIPAIMDNVSTTGIESAHVIELVFHILYK